MRRPTTSLSTLIAVAVLAVAARVAVQVLLGFYQAPQTWEHEEIARNIVAGKGYSFDHLGSTWHAYAPPLYAFVIAAVYAVFGVSAGPIGIVQALMGAVLTAAVWAIGRRVGGPAVAALSGLGAATHPGLLVYAAEIHPLNLDAMLAALGVLLVLRSRERTGGAEALCSGVVVGLMLLTRATLAPFVVIGRLVAGLASSRPLREAARPVGVLLLVAAAVAAPWVIRNAVVVGYPTLTTGVGEVFWIGNNPVANGGALTADGRPILDAAPDVREKVWGRPELVADEVFRDEAIAYVAQDPMRAARADLRKLASFWWPTERTGLLYPAPWSRMYLVYYVAVIVLAVVGAVRCFRSGKRFEVSVILLLAAILSIEQSVFFVEGRHRWELEAVILVFSSAGVLALVDAVRRIATMGARTLDAA